MYKKAWCTCKVVVLLIKPIGFFLRSRYRPRRWIFKSLFWRENVIAFFTLLRVRARIGTLRNNDVEGNGNVKKAKNLMSKTTALRCITLFCTFLYRPCTTAT